MISDYGETRARNVLRNGDHIRHAIPRRSLPHKIQVKLVLQYPLLKLPHTEQRVLHGFAKQTPAQEVVIQRNAHIVNEVRALSPMEESQLIPPACEENSHRILRPAPAPMYRWETNVAVQNLHALQNHIPPLLRPEGIALALYEFFKQTDRPGVDADDEKLVALIGTRVIRALDS